MFHKSKTETERQKFFDDYILSILKQKQVVKKNKKIIDDQEFSYDPTMDEDKVKGAFNSYVELSRKKLLNRTTIYKTKD